MLTKPQTRKLYVVLMHSVRNGEPLGGGPSRVAERLTHAEAEDDVAALKRNGCDGFVRVESQDSYLAGRDNGTEIYEWPTLMQPRPEVM
jgi:hypothetical protein